MSGSAIDECGNAQSFRDELVQESEPLCAELYIHNAQPGDVSAWLVVAGDETLLHRIAAGHEDDRDRCCRALGGKRRCCAERCDNDGHATPDQVRDHFRQPLFLAVRIPVFDGYVAAFDVASFAQAFVKCC